MPTLSVRQLAMPQQDSERLPEAPQDENDTDVEWATNLLIDVGFPSEYLDAGAEVQAYETMRGRPGLWNWTRHIWRNSSMVLIAVVMVFVLARLSASSKSGRAALEQGPGHLSKKVSELQGAVVGVLDYKNAPSLYCFSVTQSHGYELELMRAQANASAGIFGCNRLVAFSDKAMPLMHGVQPVTTTVPLPISLSCKVGGEAGSSSWTNSRIFLAAWEWIGKRKEYLQHEYVVKVDPDAVFFPAALRGHLAQSVPASHQKKPLYFQNCGKNAPPGFGLYGALEVLSSAAVWKLVNALPACKEAYPKWHSTGEDMLLQQCLDHLEVPFIRDYALLRDALCDEPVTVCNSGEVAFHPFKSVGVYHECLAQAGGAGSVSTAQYGMMPNTPLPIAEPTSTSTTATTSTTTSTTVTSMFFGSDMTTTPAVEMAVVPMDPGVVKVALAKAGLRWVDGMEEMLGHAYPYMETSQPGLVALTASDHGDRAFWYFPREVVTMVPGTATR